MSIYPNAKEFRNLNGARHDYRFQHELSLWPDLVPNGKYIVRANEYWMLSDLLDIIQPADREYYSAPLTLEIALSQNTPKPFAKNLSQNHIYYNDEKSDIELTRYAAWALVKEIGKKTPTTFFQEYFLNPKQPIEYISKKVNQTERLVLRAQSKELTKQLDGIFYSLGAAPRHFAEFNHQKMGWLFYGKTKQDLVKTYQLLPNIANPKPKILADPSRVNLQDYMNVRLLSAYIDAMKKIIEQWDENPNQHNYEYLSNITYNAIKSLCIDFSCHDTSTLGNLSRFGVKTIEHWQKLRETEFTKNYINKRIR